MLSAELVEGYGFMREHAGYVVGRRAEGALELARAEALLLRAVDLGVASVAWLDDEVFDHDADVVAGIESGRFVGPFGCMVGVGAEVSYPTSSGVETMREETASLWGIVVEAPTWRGDDPFLRVVAAELAFELFDSLRQAVGDTLDAALLARVPAVIGAVA